MNELIQLINKMRLPSFPLAEERVNEQSDVRVSRPGGHYRQCRHHALTHPGLASLAGPLFAARKEGKTATLTKSSIKQTITMKPTFITLLKSGAIAGNLLFILWVSFNAIKENFSGTVYEKISYVALMGLLIVNIFLLIRSFKAETTTV